MFYVLLQDLTNTTSTTHISSSIASVKTVYRMNQSMAGWSSNPFLISCDGNGDIMD